MRPVPPTATISTLQDIPWRLAAITNQVVSEGLPPDPVSDVPGLHVHAYELRDAGQARQRGLRATEAVALYLVTASAPSQHQALAVLVQAAVVADGEPGWWVEWRAPAAGMWRAWRADPRPSWSLAVPLVLLPIPAAPPPVRERLHVRLHPVPPPSET